MQPRALLAAVLALAGTACASVPRAGGEVDLVVAATTDVHGWMRGWDYYRGVPDSARGLARAATIVDSLRAAAPGRVLLVDAGDLLQGTPLTFLAARADSSAPHPVIAEMNAMRYDAAAVGNHEFNSGLPALERAVSRVDFPFLAANAYRADGSRAFPAFRIVQRAGVRVGIVGATTPGSMVWDAANLRGRLVIRDIVPAVRGAVNEARAAGADVIVVVMHSGLDEPATYDTVATGLPSENVAARVAREVPGIDLLVYGHSHKEMADTVIGSTLVVQPRYWAGSVSAAHLALARTSGAWRVVRRRATLVPAAGHAESREVVRAVDRAHRAALAYVATPIGTTPGAWRADSARVADTPIIDFILEVERRATGADLASASAFDLGATLGPGPITIAQVARLYPYENTLAAVRVSGRHLREYLEQSARYFRSIGAPGATRFVVDTTVAGYNFDMLAGADYVLDLSRPIGSRVASLTVKGKPVADTDTFTLALNNYRQSGGGGYSMLQGAPVVYTRGLAIRQLLIDEVRRRGTIRPADYFTRNWSIAPAAAVGELLPLTRTRFDSPSPSARDTSRRANTTRPTTLRIISTNDLHGILRPVPDSTGEVLGGAAHVATMVARLRAECAPPACVSLWLDGGDMMQGGPASNAFFGRPVMQIYDRVDVAGAAVGNHEFDWGIDTLRARMADARFRIMAANVRTAGGQPVPWIPADTIIERGGLRIGVIGVATRDTPTSTKPENVVSLRFLDPAPVVSERTRSLRARGADVVVVVGHVGGWCERWGRPGCSGEVFTLANRLTERVDAIVSGHSHSPLAVVANGTPIVQALSRGRAVGTIDLPIGRPGEPRTALHMVHPESLPPDPAVDSIVGRATAAIESTMGRVVGTTAERMPKSGSQHALGLLVADAMRVRGGGDVAIINNGGMRTGVAQGRVTYGDLFDVHPFGNLLVRVTVSGATLRQWAEAFLLNGYPNVHVSGIVVRYDSLAARGHRVVNVTTSDGRAIDLASTYRVVLPDFVLAGGDDLGPPTPPTSRTTLDATVLDAIIAYLQSQPSPVRAPSGVRFVNTRRAP